LARRSSAFYGGRHTAVPAFHIIRSEPFRPPCNSALEARLLRASLAVYSCWIVFGSFSFIRRRAVARRLRFVRCSSVVVGACRHRRRRHCFVPVGLHRFDVPAAARYSSCRASRVRPRPAAKAPSALRVGLVVRASVT